MNCKYCGGQVDDPFWDDTCHECDHEMNHDQKDNFYPSCDMCIGEAEEHFEQGERWNGEEWTYAS